MRSAEAHIKKRGGDALRVSGVSVAFAGLEDQLSVRIRGKKGERKARCAPETCLKTRKKGAKKGYGLRKNLLDGSFVEEGGVGGGGAGGRGLWGLCLR